MTDSDASLLARARAGESEAFRVLVERYAPRVFNVILRMAGDGVVAEDLLQDSLLKAYRSLPGFRGESSFHTWLHRIAVNLTLNWLRRTRGRIRFESLDEPVRVGEDSVRRDVPDWTGNPEQRAAAGETMAVVERAVAELGDANRVVFTLREMEGMDFAAIAELLECTEEAVRTRLHRAKKQLRARLRPYVGAASGEQGPC